MLEECKHYINYFNINLDFVFLNGFKETRIYSPDYYIDYNDSLTVFKKHYKQNQINIALDPLDISRSFMNTSSIEELKYLAQKYEFISFDTEDLAYLFPEFSSITCENYSESLEGLRWQKIFYIKESKIIDVECLRSLEVFMDHKVWKDFIYPYVNSIYVDLVDFSLNDLYFSLFLETPKIVPLNKSDLDNYVFIKKIGDGKKKIISKYLASFVNAPVLYIGEHPTQSVTNSVNYSPVIKGAYPFNSAIINLKDDDFKNHAYTFGLISCDKSFYKEIVFLIKQDVLAFFKDQPYGKWHCFLETTAELIKLLKNIKNIFHNCIEVIKKYDLNISCSYKDFDFFDYNKKIGINISFSLVYGLLAESLEILKRYDLDQYVIVSPFKIQIFDFDEIKIIENKKQFTSKYKDLFYWNIIDY